MGITPSSPLPQIRTGQISLENTCDPQPKSYTSPLCISYGIFIYLQDIRKGPRIRIFLEKQHFENTIDPKNQIYISKSLFHIYRLAPVISQ